MTTRSSRTHHLPRTPPPSRRGSVVVVVASHFSSSFSSFSVSSASSGDASGSPTAMPPPAEGRPPRRPAGPRPRRGRRRRRRARQPRAPRAPPRTRARRSSASPGGLGGTRARVSLGATRLSSPLVPSATWRREARRYPNPEAPLRSCARERVKGSGSREVEATVAFQFRVAMCRKKPRAPRIGRELLHARRALFALGVLIRHEELLGGRATAARGSSSSKGRLLAHRALPTPSRVPTPNPTTAGRRRDDFRKFQRCRDVVACQSTSRAAGTRLRALRTAMGRGGRSDDEATPYDQSLEELEFMRGACAAAQRGDLRTLRDAVARRPHLLADDGVGGQRVRAAALRRARGTRRVRLLPTRGGRARGPCHQRGPRHRAAPRRVHRAERRHRHLAARRRRREGPRRRRDRPAQGGGAGLGGFVRAAAARVPGGGRGAR